MYSTLVRISHLALLVLLLGTAPALAETPTPPSFYAIHDVTVVTGDGTRLEGATVLLADGLIEAVGTRIDIPGDAWRIDGEGLFLYPGLFDGLSHLGQPQESESDGSSGRGGSGDSPSPLIRGPQDRPATTPWLEAADQLTDDDGFAKWREAGFTTALTAPEKGLFAGQAAVVHLGDVEPRDRVLASSVAQRLGFQWTPPPISRLPHGCALLHRPSLLGHSPLHPSQRRLRFGWIRRGTPRPRPISRSSGDLPSRTTRPRPRSRSVNKLSGWTRELARPR